MTQALIFAITAIAQLFLLVLLLRLWLPWLRADFRNPIAQGVLKLTSPLVIPVRRVIPPLGRLDTATVLIAFAFQCIVIVVISLIIGGPMPPAGLIAFAALMALIVLSIRLFLFAILISVILSWVAPGGYNPAIEFVRTIAEPVLRPFRRFLPPMGGFDISPVFAMIGLMTLTIWLDSFRPLPY